MINPLINVRMVHATLFVLSNILENISLGFTPTAIKNLLIEHCSSKMHSSIGLAMMNGKIVRVYSHKIIVKLNRLFSVS